MIFRLPLLFTLAFIGLSGAAVEFNRDVRPILSDKCFHCHGFDANTRKAKLRLDVREDAVKATAIVPGKPELSEAIQRIVSPDPDEVMPPAEHHDPLTPAQIAVLKQWIAEGAEYQPHWAFVAPKRVEADSIDAIVQADLAKLGLRPSPEADKSTLIRRAALALTGLPPTPAEVDAFLSDQSPKAYENVVDRLLASPHFGERLALDWLDAARYADTNGYFTDGERPAWPWRDWVIAAFNANMPFDQFTIEQLAGDLLPSPTPAQRIATAFNRNHMVSNESGLIEEEYRMSYVSDRVETTAATWLGLTVGCAKCHDHKFDPITQRDYYSLFAAFNNIDEKGIVKEIAPLSALPSVPLPTQTQETEIARLEKERKAAEAEMKALQPGLAKDIAAWEGTVLAKLPPAPAGSLVHFPFDADPLDHGPRKLKSSVTGKLISGPGLRGPATVLDATQYVDFAEPKPVERDQPFTLSVWIQPSSSPQGCVASKQDSDANGRGFEILWYKAQPRINLAHRYGADGIEVVSKEKFASGKWKHLVVTYDGSSRAAGLRVYVDGVLSEVDVRRDNLSGSIASAEPWRIGWKGTGIGFDGGLDEFRLFDRALSADEVTALHWREFLEGTLAVTGKERLAAATEKLQAYYIEHEGNAPLRALSTQVTDLRAGEQAAKRAVLTLSVMQESEKPRETRILMRGQYDQPGEPVQFAVPAALGKLPANAPANRLGLAQWLVSTENPLTARVEVNRLWAQCFGDGLLRTPDDFGLQGEIPTHPELLDWLALRFRDGWDVKGMLKMIVMSGTFRQSSHFTPELLARDPANRLLARGPRFRLPAELIRDQALAASGLLVRDIGGPSVKPPQPAGLWEAVSYNGESTYVAGTGSEIYRRGLYTFWKRQSPPPDLLTFDGPTREVCTIRRPRTNTPLQALLLMNDENYLGAARALGERMSREGMAQGFRLATGRAAKAPELAELQRYWDEQATAFRERPQDAAPFGTPVQGAWTMTANLLLNLDEVQNQH